MSQLSVEEPNASEQIGSPCVACRLPLPIQPAPISEEGEYWLCKDCGTRHHGILLPNAPAEISRNVTPSEEKKKPVEQRAAAPQKKKLTQEPLPARDAVVCTHETAISRLLDNSIEEGISLTVDNEGPAFLEGIKSHGVNPYDTQLKEEFSQQYDHACDQLEGLMASLEKEDEIQLETTQSITRESLCQAAQDMDLFVKLGINPPDKDYAGKHNYHVAMLAASMAANMKWDEKSISEIGVGCLLHDIGMSRVSPELLNANRVLSPGEFVEIARHPIHTFDYLERRFDDVPIISRMVAYQIHERCDGSGYPRNRRGLNIHEAARVAAVADVYMALISPRPHRPPMMPHFAVKHLLFGVRDGKFDSEAVRALLNTVSLFPIGSYLELKDGRVGQVIRVRPEQYAKPLLEVWHPDRLDESPQVVDLSQQPELEVLRPLSSLN